MSKARDRAAALCYHIEEIEGDLVRSGMPLDAVASLRQGHADAVLASPQALAEVRLWLAGREETAVIISFLDPPFQVDAYDIEKSVAVAIEMLNARAVAENAG